ncbi:hypothetical protein LFL96_37005 (plasmid) [Paraburkholderia sp. D15]|uniref:hypothetical protein n=1 Tax=Paraburkholderia sp. D15 TaxID=2880218 RepID=UPI00247B1BBD|nr:hypothetical protein [Paraburkholderia sp. D15]WGS55079.1 hypothetical protein LFL96_37005 [Paraburkholderia sp. D15]
MDQLLRCYRAFDALPFIVKRAIYCFLFVLLGLYGVHVGRTDLDTAGKIEYIGAIGFIWASGLWYPLWILLRCIIFFKVRPW